MMGAGVIEIFGHGRERNAMGADVIDLEIFRMGADVLEIFWART